MILNLIHSTFGYCYPHYACRKEIMNCFMLKQPFYNSMNQNAETKKAPVSEGSNQEKGFILLLFQAASTELITTLPYSWKEQMELFGML